MGNDNNIAIALQQQQQQQPSNSTADRPIISKLRSTMAKSMRTRKMLLSLTYRQGHNQGHSNGSSGGDGRRQRRRHHSAPQQSSLSPPSNDKYQELVQELDLYDQRME